MNGELEQFQVLHRPYVPAMTGLLARHQVVISADRSLSIGREPSDNGCSRKAESVRYRAARALLDLDGWPLRRAIVADDGAVLTLDLGILRHYCAKGSSSEWRFAEVVLALAGNGDLAAAVEQLDWHGYDETREQAVARSVSQRSGS